MAEESAIEWTTATWNPWRGCSKVSPGCARCYMFRDQRRYGRDPEVVVRAADNTFYAPVRAKKWRELPVGSMVFTCSWSDWFHADADEWRDDAWEVVRQRPDLTWQILTKRPERIADNLPSDWGEGWPNVWLGVSIENRRFVGRADVLRSVPAAVRFISAEPLLGPLFIPASENWDGSRWDWPDLYDGPELNLSAIDWVIAGGESGARARPMKAEWVRDIRDACLGREVAFFFKQWGGSRPGGAALLDGREHRDFPVPKLTPPGGSDA